MRLRPVSGADEREVRATMNSGAFARAIGLGRLLAGGAFLAAPVAATRALGLDTATAKRVAFLARMMAARDVAIGAGTTASGLRGGRPAGWLLAGAAADAADAVVIAAAIRDGRARGPVAAGVVAIAAGAAAVAVVGALSPCRRPS
jgi:hypothetical protein